MAEWVDPDFDLGPVGAWADAVNLGGVLDDAEGDDEEWHSDVGEEEYIEAGPAANMPDTSDKYWADPAEATQEVLDLLLDKWTTGERIYAVDVCVICWWLKLAGIGGLVADISKRPGGQPGKYKGHLRRKLGIDKLASARLSTLSVPCSDKHTGVRVDHKMPVWNPYEAINLEVAEDETLHQTWRDAVDGDSLPPMYTDHVVVQSAAARAKTALGLCLYVDGVPTTKRDGLIGFWVYVLESTKRHLCAVIQKSRLCNCGCKGWCSFWVIFNWLHWNCVIMADGYHPCTDHVLNLITDPTRLAIVGEALLFIGALICIKGDWMEYGTTFAFTTWSNKTSPCNSCWCTSDNMYDDAGFNGVDELWELFGMNDYVNACDSCEISVRVTCREECQRIHAVLLQDRRGRGAGGVAIKPGSELRIGNVQLTGGDRLEPSVTLQDTGKILDLTSFPVAILFWRKRQNRVKHRNPLFDARLGITPLIMLVDLLHAVNLGCMKHMSTELMWQMLWDGVWGLRGGKDRPQEQWLAEALPTLRSQLNVWQDDRERAEPLKKHTRIQYITDAMVGTASSRCLALKAAETKAFFFFLADTIPLHVDVVWRGREWAACARALQQLLQAMARMPWKLSSTDYKEQPSPTIVL